MWEYSNADLGYTYDTPTIVKLNNGQWGAIFGNGYNNSGTGQSGIFIVNIQTGTLIAKILTGVGSAATPNGIGAARVVDIDGNGTADVVYGGDLTGRMWKFDLTDSNASNWVVAFSGSPLFLAGQPITSAPEVTPHPLGGYMVVFGTGQYLATGDPATTATQSLYGVRDYANNSIDRTSLVQQTITSVVTLGTNNYRTVSANAVNWATKNGWYLDLPTSGERLVVDPVLRFGRAVFVTLIPNPDPCSSGGSSWLMEIDYQTGGQPTVRTLDTNGDNTVDVSDTLVGGVQVTGGIASSVTVRSLVNNLETKFMNLSSGTILRQLEAGGTLANRRMSWRQER
jgi:type IV pilus assembly protein PilY1